MVREESHLIMSKCISISTKTIPHSSHQSAINLEHFTTHPSISCVYSDSSSKLLHCTSSCFVRSYVSHVIDGADAVLPQQTGEVHLMLTLCWASVASDGPGLQQHWVDVPYFLGRVSNLQQSLSSSFFTLHVFKLTTCCSKSDVFISVFAKIIWFISNEMHRMVIWMFIIFQLYD